MGPHWPDICHLVKKQGPLYLHMLSRIAQRIEGTGVKQYKKHHHKIDGEWNEVVTMDIDVQNVLKWCLDCDAQGHSQCFNCNIYGYVSKHCWKHHQQPLMRQVQNVQFFEWGGATLG